MEFTRFNGDFAQNIILLDDFNNPTDPTEDIPNYFGTSFDKLSILNVEQRDVFVDLVGFFGNPEDCATLDDLIALFGFTLFLDI